MKRLLAATNRDRGATFLEYALIASVVAITAIVAVQVLGGSVASSLSDSGDAFAQGQTEEVSKVDNSKTAKYKDDIKATFEVTDKKLSLGDVNADGWTYKVTKDTGRKITMKFTSDESGQVVTVKGWLNKKDNLKTNVKAKKNKTKK